MKTLETLRQQLSQGEFEFSRHGFQKGRGAEHQRNGNPAGWS